MRQVPKTYADKMAQTTREAIASVVALAATIFAWWLFGFGFSALDWEIFHTPFWVFAGTVGTWLFAILACVILASVVFKNFSLDEEDSEIDDAEVSHD